MAVVSLAGTVLRQIVEAAIVPSNCRLGRFQATVMVQFDDGSLEDVLSYYDDELCFAAHEFVGLTASEVTLLFLQRDSAYLRS